MEGSNSEDYNNNSVRARIQQLNQVGRGPSSNSLVGNPGGFSYSQPQQQQQQQQLQEPASVRQMQSSSSRPNSNFYGNGASSYNYNNPSRPNSASNIENSTDSARWSAIDLQRNSGDFHNNNSSSRPGSASSTATFASSPTSSSFNSAAQQQRPPSQRRSGEIRNLPPVPSSSGGNSRKSNPASPLATPLTEYSARESISPASSNSLSRNSSVFNNSHLRRKEGFVCFKIINWEKKKKKIGI